MYFLTIIDEIFVLFWLEWRRRHFGGNANATLFAKIYWTVKAYNATKNQLLNYDGFVYDGRNCSIWNDKSWNCPLYL